MEIVVVAGPMGQYDCLGPAPWERSAADTHGDIVDPEAQWAQALSSPSRARNTSSLVRPPVPFAHTGHARPTGVVVLLDC